ncbi:MAG: GMC family oxidoreductase N-terminal domain-containing protein [Novosphingobium sp.]|nr:GMC family oxidoreductase N-terminal domain-containing protein [Novosphingobium sp.]
MRQFDYVIVGAGSAGCVLANRLSEDPDVSVAVVEAGGDNAHPYVSMPRGVAKLVRMPAFMYFYMTRAVPNTGMRPDIWLRGKGLGGSSAVNGMVWVRGQPADYEELAAQTSADWSWENIARAYEAIEAHELGPAPSRGGSGPLRVSLAAFANQLTDAILDAGAAVGWPVKQDVNAPDDGEGIGHMPRSIWRGKRQSAAVAFLKPAMGRPNLTVITSAVTDKVEFDGTRATGITVIRDGERETFGARREVILSAGAVASPGILERSGIGDPQRLGELGIPVVHANPAVGEGASEHRALRMQWRLKHQNSLNREFRGWRLARNVLRYYLTHDGPMSGASIDMRIAFRSSAERNRADIQAQIGLYSWDLAGAGGELETEPGFCAVINPISPASRGSIHIASTDPLAMPDIDAQYGASEEDRAVTAAAARRLREWAATEPLAALIETETAPGPEAQSDDAILAALDAQGCAGMHTVGTCRMGKDEASVVDPELRVRGVQGLRVIDASVFPAIPSGNTNAPTLALAWRAAEIMKSRP